MSFPTTCPQCLTSYRLPEKQAGLRVRCKHCTATFLAQDNGKEGVKKDPIPFVEEVADHFKTQTKRPPYEHFQQEDRDRRLHLAKGEGDPADGDPSGGPGLVFAFVGSVLVLLALAGGLAWFFTASPTPPEPPAPAAARLEPPPVEVPVAPAVADPVRPALKIEPAPAPTDVATALALLQGDDDARKRVALAWLRTAPVEEARREEVALALNRPLDEAALRQEALAAVARWGGKPNAERLVALVDEPAGTLWAQAAEILARLDDDGAVEAVSRQLPAQGRTAQAARALRAASPRLGEKHVVKYLHHPDGQLREEAAKLLSHYGTPAAVLLEQSSHDLVAKDARTRLAACQWLAKQPPDSEQQGKVARALAGRLEDDDGIVKLAAMAALERWATRENVKAVCAAMKHALLQPSALRILARLKDEGSIGTLVEYLLSPSAKDVATVLVSFGAKAERPTWRQLENKVPDVRVLACAVLAEVGGRESVERLTRFAKAYPAQKKVAQAAIKKIQGRLR